VREHFGIRVGLEGNAAGLQLRAELRSVLDDAVVNDGEAPGAVGVRMRVAIARFAVRRPARVRDAGCAFQLRGQLPFQVTHFALGFVDAELVVACTGDARRVVTAILETMQSLHEDRTRIALADITDDSAHGYSRRWRKAWLSLRFQ
jgi:hypothetical protein